MSRGGSRPGERRGGRKPGTPNKSTREIKELVDPYMPAALKELGRLAIKAESEQARVSAIGMLLDRRYGKAKQSVEHTGKDGGPIRTIDLSKATDEHLAALEAIFGPLASAEPGDGSGEGRAGQTEH